MSAWIVVPCLLALRGEFNAISPNRDKGADGTIGDSAHSSSSDHTPDEDSDVLRSRDADRVNEVHALDIDSSGPWPGSGTQKQRFHAIIMRILAGERAKWRSATDKCRLEYVIWDGQIYDKDNDFQPVKYNGQDQHTNHAHFSARYETSCENDTRPWGVIQGGIDDMALSDDDKRWLAAEIDKAASRAAERVWSTTRNIGGPGPEFLAQLGDVLKNTPYEHGAQGQRLSEALTKIDTVLAKLSELSSPEISKEVVRAAMIDIITGAGQ